MKKGFTIVEIILSIGLVVVIGSISIFSFNIIKKNNKEKTLESMSETIFNAVNIYLESNTDIKNQLYKNKNGLKIPLTTLENSGLVDFGSLSDDLDEGDFVVTMLGTPDPNDDTCAKTYTVKSWNITDNETIYICEKSDGTQNLVTVAGKADNLSKGTRERYWFKGYDAANFIQLEWDTSKKYRIMYIDKDDSLVLYNEASFANVFNGLTLSISGVGLTSNSSFNCVDALKSPLITDSFVEYSYSNGEMVIDPYDIANTSLCTMSFPHATAARVSNYQNSISNWLTGQVHYSNIDNPAEFRGYSGYKIHLKPCVKI